MSRPEHKGSKKKRGGAVSKKFRMQKKSRLNPIRMQDHRREKVKTFRKRLDQLGTKVAG